MLQAGYHRNTAWIFSKGETEVYDSSGSEMGMEYIGYGAGAYSVIGKWKKEQSAIENIHAWHGHRSTHDLFK